MDLSTPPTTDRAKRGRVSDTEDPTAPPRKRRRTTATLVPADEAPSGLSSQQPPPSESGLTTPLPTLVDEEDVLPLESFQGALVGDEPEQAAALFARLDNAGRQAFEQAAQGYLYELPGVVPSPSALWWSEARVLVQEELLRACTKGPLGSMMTQLVGVEWHDQFLRAPRATEHGCSARERCEGYSIPKWGKLLVAYEEPNKVQSTPPMCLLCTRQCWFRLAVAEIAKVPEFRLDSSAEYLAEPTCCLNSHAVKVGCIGGYSANYVVRTASGNTLVRGFSGHVLRYSRTHYEVDPEDENRLSQAALLFQ